MRNSLLVIFLLFISISPLFALPYSLSGNKINIPDAYILPHKMATIGVAFAPGITSMTKDGSNDFIFNAITNLNFGLYDRGEVGLILNSYGIPYMNFKLQLLKEKKRIPQLSIGMTNVFSSVTDSNYPAYSEGLVGSKDDLVKNSPYIVASKKAIMVSNITGLEYIELSGLLGWGMRRFKGDGQIAKYLNGFFLGIDLKPTRFLSLYSEIDGENFSAGLNIYSRHFTYQFSVYQVEEALKFVLAKGSINVGLNIIYTLDHFSEQKISGRDDYYSYYKTISPLIERRVIVENVIPEEDASIYEELPMFKELQDLKQKRKEKEDELARLRKLFEEE
ncbi:MAG: hypothetical protein K9N06_00060 [Candidatus Cloacimonetes bacterium]|nr:hypothetical protein [Candidatus Cloacimonadota bacterium]